MGRQQRDSASPTERAIDECKARGWKYVVAEGWQRVGEETRHCKECGHPAIVPKWVRKDFGGFADIVAMDRASNRHVAIQVTSGGNHASRVRKICKQPMGDARSLRTWTKRVDLAASWLESGGEILVWSWRLCEKTLPRWQMRETIITLHDLEIGQRKIQRTLG